MQVHLFEQRRVVTVVAVAVGERERKRAGGERLDKFPDVAPTHARIDEQRALVSVDEIKGVVFRVPDPETSDVMSRLLGEAQISRIVASGGESENKSFQQVFGSKSKNENWQQQITNDRIVLPGELQNLETLHGFLNLAGSIPTAPILLEPVNRPQTAATFDQATREAIKIKPAIQTMAEMKQAEINNISDSDLPPGMEGDF